MSHGVNRPRRGPTGRPRAREARRAAGASRSGYFMATGRVNEASPRTTSAQAHHIWTFAMS